MRFGLAQEGGAQEGGLLRCAVYPVTSCLPRPRLMRSSLPPPLRRGLEDVRALFGPRLFGKPWRNGSRDYLHERVLPHRQHYAAWGRRFGSFGGAHEGP